MKLHNSQRGMTFWSTASVLFAIGFTAYVILKLLPVYMDDLSIGSALEGVQDGAAAEDHRTVSSVRTALVKRFNVNNVDVISSKDVQIVREGNYYLVNIDYQVIVPFIGNISLLISFDHSGSVLAAN